MKRCPQCNRFETDEALKFCRVDGVELISDSSPLSADAGTAQLASTQNASEVHTSILPHRTDANINRGTAPTTVLPLAAPVTTGALATPKRRTTAIVIVVIAVVTFAAVGAFLVSSYLSKKNSASVESIAVLPFENKSGNPDSEYLSDGLAESLIYRLSQLPNLKVSPTSAVFRYKGKETDAQKVGAELGVNAVMMGRMVQRGDQLTLSVELVDARNNKLIWGEQFERKMSELLATQRDIASAITDKLQLKLSGENARGITKHYTENNEAYQLYLKGRFYWNKRTVDGLKQAATYYQQAIEKDPGFALAYSGLADTYALFSAYSVASPKESMPEAKAAAMKAIELDSSLAEPHATFGVYYSGYEYNLKAAEDELKRAVQLNPNYPTGYHWLALTLVPLGKDDEAIATARRAEQLDPLSAIISADTAFDFFLLHRFDEAIAQAQHTLQIDPNFYYAHYLMGKAYNQKRMYKEALAELRKAVELSPDPIVRATLAQSLVLSGQRAEATKLIDELKSESTRRYIPNYFLATTYLALGDRDTALTMLEKDLDEHCIYLQWIALDPELDGLRNDPRFAALVQKVGVGLK